MFAKFLNYARLVIEFKILAPYFVLLKRLYARIDRKSDHDNLMVNLGGGYFYRRHWTNLDYRSSHYQHNLGLIDRNFDLTSGQPLPFRDGSVKLFYSSHTLEHIPDEFCQHILKEMYRCLKPGGMARLTMPDFDVIYERYSQGIVGDPHRFATPTDELLNCFATALMGLYPDEKVNQDFLSMTKEEFADYYISLAPPDSQARNRGNHVNWWNGDKLRRYLEKAGFREVYRSVPGQSRAPEMRHDGSFAGLEKLFTFAQVRGFDKVHPETSVFVEAVK